jgi:CRP/FNR family cyclic AMP-dependent transcriptional regulator
MHWTEVFGYVGALLTLATFSMKTMVHLRMVGIAANVAFASYGLAGQVYPVLLLHLILLPLNTWRLAQLLRLTRQIEDASVGEFSVEWLKPFTRHRLVGAGEVLFQLGDAATEVLIVLRGRFRAVQANATLERGDVFGELGLVSKDHVRTQTVVCEEAGELLSITYDEVRQLYFQNPKFGFFFLRLVAERLARDAKQAQVLRGATGATGAA